MDLKGTQLDGENACARSILGMGVGDELQSSISPIITLTIVRKVMEQSSWPRFQICIGPPFCRC